MRSLRMSGLFALLGFGLLAPTAQSLGDGPLSAGTPYLLAGLVWFGLDFLLLALAYLMAWPGLLGKTRAGRFSFWALILFLPYRVYAKTIWNLARVTSSEPAFNEVNPGLIIGRRLLPSEPQPIFNTLVDLTCEMNEWPTFSHLPGYRWFPILDAAAPTPEALHEAVRMIHPRPRLHPLRPGPWPHRPLRRRPPAPPQGSHHERRSARHLEERPPRHQPESPADDLPAPLRRTDSHGIGPCGIHLKCPFPFFTRPEQSIIPRLSAA